MAGRATETALQVMNEDAEASNVATSTHRPVLLAIATRSVMLAVVESL
jgi:hypothetical protein